MSAHQSSVHPARLKQVPDSLLSLVDPVLKQARTRHIAVFVAQPVCFTQVRCELLVVVLQLNQHVRRCDIVCVAVPYSLPPRYLTDRMEGSRADFSNSLCYDICRGKDLRGLLIQ